jgi:hypothetical protein
MDTIPYKREFPSEASISVSNGRIKTDTWLIISLIDNYTSCLPYQYNGIFITNNISGQLLTLAIYIVLRFVFSWSW